MTTHSYKEISLCHSQKTESSSPPRMGRSEVGGSGRSRALVWKWRFPLLSAKRRKYWRRTLLRLRDDRMEKLDLFRPRTNLRLAEGGLGQGPETEKKGGGNVNTRVMAFDSVRSFGSVNPSGEVSGGSR